MQVLLKEESYEIITGRGALKNLHSSIRSLDRNYSSALILSDHRIAKLYGEEVKEQVEKAGLPCSMIAIEPGETAKSLEMADHCWREMHCLGVDRNSLLIALGGGVICDLGGFIASCYMRGIDAIYLPTSLLAMVDAAIGGKTGINLPTGKNLIGTFFQPQLVLNDCSLLKTLSPREFWAGIAEVIKYGIIADPQLFEWLEKHIETLSPDCQEIEMLIERSCEIKAGYVAKDLHDRQRYRAHLNWGHTFGHALEKMTGFTQLMHGEAIAIGMSCAASLSHNLGYVDESFIERVDALCQRAHLPTQLPASLSLPDFFKAMYGDKKCIGKELSFIIAEKIGKVCCIEGVKEERVQQSLEKKLSRDHGNI